MTMPVLGSTGPRTVTSTKKKKGRLCYSCHCYFVKSKAENKIMESSISLTDKESNEAEKSDVIIQHIVTNLLEHLDNILYRKHILQMSQKTVCDALENALHDFVNLYFIGEKFACLCTPETFQLDNDHEMQELSKDSLQL